MTKFFTVGLLALTMFVLSCAEQKTGVPVEFSKACGAENSGKLIQLTGYLADQGSIFCRNFTGAMKCGLKLLENPGSENPITVDVSQGTSANQIEEIKRGYKAEDVRIRDNGGNVINLANKLKVTRKMLVSVENNVCNMAVSKIEK